MNILKLELFQILMFSVGYPQCPRKRTELHVLLFFAGRVKIYASLCQNRDYLQNGCVKLTLCKMRSFIVIGKVIEISTWLCFTT